ncbi:MAG TPA: tetratricopeptide repeat protein, partial [Candidatus Woesebacteria bacterium]|nr:tetratricopeptide repeat protein [Candidatus Woesebacteria bacterium]
MKNLVPLHKMAIEAAKAEDWQQAIALNQEILAEDPTQLGALNRLALAWMQLGKLKEAAATLTKVLEIDKNNKIALKNLSLVKKRQNGKVASFANGHSYIQEPGKAKIVTLSRLTSAKELAELSACQECYLDPKSSSISVISSNGRYIGALHKDIANRLLKLISTGNQYQCIIYSVDADNKQCKVHLKEKYVSPQNQGVTSFPIESIQAEYQDPDMLSIEYELKSETNLDLFGEDEEINAEGVDSNELELNEEPVV